MKRSLFACLTGLLIACASLSFASANDVTSAGVDAPSVSLADIYAPALAGVVDVARAPKHRASLELACNVVDISTDLSISHSVDAAPAPVARELRSPRWHAVGSDIVYRSHKRHDLRSAARGPPRTYT